MTGQEAAFFIGGILIIIAMILGAAGAAFDEKKEPEAAKVFLALAAACFGIGAISFGKGLLMFFIN